MSDLPPRHEPPKKNGLTDYGPKTGAASDHPYDFDEIPPPPATEGTPPDAHTDIDSEADLNDPMVRRE
ncbi:hypothetical protein [Asticcacaulis sp.]|uniref:hypothetical protein n=1 Tax=Asticcacaulis sp. TaxID=1872648 RepID=UPI0026128386|nr:hypothetical protein [Asticcacaulis sp.]